jgi:hypothetical protein
MILHYRRQSGLRLDGWREGWAISPRRRLPVPARGHINHARIERLDVLVAKSEARKRAGPEILDDDICAATELRDDLARLDIVQVEAKISLSCILLDVIKADAVDVGEADAS